MRKILIVGHARHGKDSVAEIIAEHTGQSYTASSMICTSFVRSAMRFTKTYLSDQECFDDRVNHRATWHKIIANYCKEDKSALAELIYKTNLIYCGIRDTAELDAVIARFNPMVIWVDASDRLPLEPASSMNIKRRSDWAVIWNDDSIDCLKTAVLERIEGHYLPKWDYRFSEQAKVVATWSKDPAKQVGCVLVSPDRNELAIGYNGLPRGIDKADDKLAMTVHAELNAILNARRNLTGWTLYSTEAPCLQCATSIVQAGLARVVAPIVNPHSSWADSQYQAQSLLKSANIVS